MRGGETLRANVERQAGGGEATGITGGRRRTEGCVEGGGGGDVTVVEVQGAGGYG